MLILYQGLKPDRYYWEFVNTLRKVLLLMSFSLLITYKPSYRIMIGVIILLITFRIQVYLNPYKRNEYNDIEIIALLTGSLTILSGLIFTSDEDQNTILNGFTLIVVIIFNITFIFKWLYQLILCLSEQYKIFQFLVLIIEVLRCKRKLNIGTFIDFLLLIRIYK